VKLFAGVFIVEQVTLCSVMMQYCCDFRSAIPLLVCLRICRIWSSSLLFVASVTSQSVPPIEALYILHTQNLCRWS